MISTLPCHYYNYHPGVTSAVITLTATVSDNGHVASWLGINNLQITSWVQGGIAQVKEGQYAYLETKSPGKSPAERYFSVRAGERIHAFLSHVGNMWRATVCIGRSCHRTKAIWIIGIPEYMGETCGSGRLTSSEIFDILYS